MKKINIIKRIIRGGMFMWFLLLVFHLFLAGRFFILNFSGSIPPLFFVLLSLLFLLHEVLQKKKHPAALGLAAIVMLLGISQGDFIIGKPEITWQVKDDSITRVKFFNWNTNCWDQYKEEKEFYTFLKKQDADIYLLQEYLHAREWDNPVDVDPGRFFAIYSQDPFFPLNYVKIDDMAEIIKAFPDYYIAVDKQFITISRYPIARSHCDSSEQYAVTDIKINGRDIRFFNVHILLHIEPGNPFDPYFYRALEVRFAARNKAFKNLKQDLENSRSDYMIAGDFNSTKAMGIMNGFLKSNIDAATYADDIVPLTFEYLGLKLWRMDYVMLSKEQYNIRITSFQNREHEDLSDHYPQYLTLEIKRVSGDSLFPYKKQVGK